MEAMRQTWTDDRMDDLAAQVDELRHELKELGRELRGEIQALRVDMNSRLRVINTEAADDRLAVIKLCLPLCLALIAAIVILAGAA